MGCRMLGALCMPGLAVAAFWRDACLLLASVLTSPACLHRSRPQVIEELSKGIVNKLLHGPMTALRCDGADPSAVTETLANMEALERMFGLADEQDLSPAQAQKVAAAAIKR